VAGDTDGPAEESFDKSARKQSSGAYTAPFSGIHGWFWEIPGGTPIKIHLASAGFYTSAVEIRSNRRRYPHAPQPLVVAQSSVPKEPSAPVGR
jgi:hypothetical protein